MIHDLLQLQHPLDFEVVQWKWQSDSDPWKEKDSTKWTWQDYIPEQCTIIEKAFSLNQATADLGDYEIDFEKMLQVKKSDKHRIRRVKRQGPSRFMMDIPEPMIVSGKDQKTINEAFGTVQHFLEYIMKRTPEAYALYQRLKSLSLGIGEDQYQDILKGVIACIEKGAETREKIIKTRSNFPTKDYISEAKKIVEEITSTRRTLADFLKVILRIYTMESFICYWLNELLRSEDWEEINVLTPYLVCLVYTFKLSNYTIKYEEPKGFMDSLIGFIVKPKIYLFRGAALTKERLEHYDMTNIKYFSWNGVTSTSRDRNVALKFIRMSLKKAQEQNEPKVGVIFKIKADLASIEDCQGMIDVSQNSKYPKEKEVILAPGTVFRLRSVRLMEDQVTEIRLKLQKKFKEIQEKTALLGSLQEQAISKLKAVINDLPSQSSLKVLQLLSGNKAIQRLEITNSGISEEIMEIVEKMRVTTNLKKQDIHLTNNTISVSCLSVLAHYYSPGSLSDVIRYNTVIFKDLATTVLKNEMKMNNLILQEEVLQKYKITNKLRELWKRAETEDQITSVTLSMEALQISTEEVKDAFKSIGNFPSLENIDLNLHPIHGNSSEVLKVLGKTLESLKTLKQFSLSSRMPNDTLIQIQSILLSLPTLEHLSLDFKKCVEFSDEGLSHLQSALASLTSLKHLSLNFNWCFQITDQGLNHLKDLLMNLTSLRYLDLGLEFCPYITPAGFRSLEVGLRHLTSLQHLSIDFGFCYTTSDEGLSYLGNALVHLTSLQHLRLEFQSCKTVSDEGMNHLASGLIPLVSLKHLHLNFFRWEMITHEGISYLKSGLESLIALKHLELSFTACTQFSDECLNHLKSGLVSLTSLEHLELGFLSCRELTDQGLNHLQNGLIPLVSLRTLSLDFNLCKKITDKGLNHLKDVLIPLNSLQSLRLAFTYCKEISNEGLNYLKDGLRHLTSLEILSLGFADCDKISDEGLKYLQDGLKPLTSLQSLELVLYPIQDASDVQFDGCDKISDLGLYSLKNGLVGLTSLQRLVLDFSSCIKIADEGLNQLKIALINLTSLIKLDLSFCFSFGITDQGLAHLKNGLISFASLQELSLNFESCIQISNHGLNYLKDGLMPLTSLQSLTLRFGSSRKISDEGLSHLKKGLATLVFLKSLYLDFGFCKFVSNEGLNHLQAALGLLTSLRSLHLGFTRCKITDTGLNYLKRGLMPLTSMRSLTLGFWDCDSISDEGLNHLKSGLMPLTSLQEISLDFRGCKKISDEGLNHLKSALSPLTCLKDVHLVFVSCSKISAEAIEDLKNSLSSRPTFNCEHY